MILPDHKIIALCQPTTLVPIDTDRYPSQMKEIDQVPMIEPFDESQVEPASYDVRLGNDFKIFQRDKTIGIDFAQPADITRHVRIEDGDYLTLHPGEFVLGVTREVVHMPNGIVSRIEGKSSVGRLGLMVHVTAGFIDPGFNGPITLEMYGVHPLALMLRPGIKIAQLSFHTMLSAAKNPYSGRYQNAKGVESSKYGQ
jgi:dCTP deaminase